MFVMENIKAFFHAATPWLMMGVVLAVFATRSAGREKRSTESEDSYSTEGMCPGMSFGACLGSLFDNTGIGIPLGMLTGLVIGSCIRKNQGGNTK